MKMSSDDNDTDNGGEGRGGMGRSGNPGRNNSNSNTLVSMRTVSVKIPPFWSNRPDLWFLTVETQFRLRKITSPQTKYDHLISSLPSETMEIVADALLNPPEDTDNPYEHLKKLIIIRSTDTEERRLDELLIKIELGDLKPSELFRKMETLAGGNSLVNKSLLNKLWQNKLPLPIRSCVIAIEASQTQAEIFKIADQIYDSSDRPRISAVESKPISRQEEDLGSLIKDLSNRLSRLEGVSRRESFRSRSRDRSTSKPTERTQRNFVGIIKNLRTMLRNVSVHVSTSHRRPLQKTKSNHLVIFSEGGINLSPTLYL